MFQEVAFCETFFDVTQTQRCNSRRASGESLWTMDAFLVRDRPLKRYKKTPLT